MSQIEECIVQMSSIITSIIDIIDVIDVNVKFFVVGDTGVGKTSIVDKSIYNIFNTDYTSSENIHILPDQIAANRTLYKTLGNIIDFDFKNDKIFKDIKYIKHNNIEYNNVKICPTLQLVDIGHKLLDEYVLSSYFNESMAAIVVIDITQDCAFTNAKKWIELFSPNVQFDNYYQCDETYPICLCFNKIDLLKQSDIITTETIDETIENFVKECHESFPNTKFMAVKCSAKDCTQTMFNNMWSEIIKHVPLKVLLNNTNIKNKDAMIMPYCQSLDYDNSDDSDDSDSEYSDEYENNESNETNENSLSENLLLVLSLFDAPYKYMIELNDDINTCNNYTETDSDDTYTYSDENSDESTEDALSFDKINTKRNITREDVMNRAINTEIDHVYDIIFANILDYNVWINTSDTPKYVIEGIINHFISHNFTVNIYDNENKIEIKWD